jgi:predicted cupin superfamily sugar epimerase
MNPGILAQRPPHGMTRTDENVRTDVRTIVPTDVRTIVRILNLAPHPERGFFVETYRAGLTVEAPQGPRAASTAIYFLLGEEQRASYLHRLGSDELFHLYDGGPLDVLLLSSELDGGGEVRRLGRDLAAGERPQLVIPAGTWFGTELPPGVPFCLWGCTVAPGFDFQDFELAQGPELAARWPRFEERIRRMTRPR